MLVQIEREQSTPSAVIHDVSTTGALLLTRARLVVGEGVRLSLYLQSGLPPTVVRARVVRVDERPPELAIMWPRSAAVQFNEPLKIDAASLESIAAKQRATFGS
jgi:hypothetical protein